MDEAVAGEAGEDVQVADDAGGLGDDADRVAGLGQDLEDRAGGAQAAFDRLVGVGVGTEGDGAGAVAGAGELGAEESGGVGLDEDLGLEVEAGREAPESVAGPGVAVDAAVLAAAIGVDRLGEGDVGRGVAGDQATGGVGDQLGARRGRVGQLVEGAPAIVERFAALGLEAVGGVEQGTAAPGWPERLHAAMVRRATEQSKNTQRRNEGWRGAERLLGIGRARPRAGGWPTPSRSGMLQAENHSENRDDDVLLQGGRSCSSHGLWLVSPAGRPSLVGRSRGGRSLRTAPYGTWRSPITPRLITAEQVGLASPWLDGGSAWWTESRPLEGGRVTLMRRRAGSAAVEVTPAPFNLRTRVHEYGGRGFVASGDLVLGSAFADQRLWRLDGAPRALTPVERRCLALCGAGARQGPRAGAGGAGGPSRAGRAAQRAGGGAARG